MGVLATSTRNRCPCFLRELPSPNPPTTQGQAQGPGPDTHRALTLGPGSEPVPGRGERTLCACWVAELGQVARPGWVTPSPCPILLLCWGNTCLESGQHTARRRADRQERGVGGHIEGSVVCVCVCGTDPCVGTARWAPGRWEGLWPLLCPP